MVKILEQYAVIMMGRLDDCLGRLGIQVDIAGLDYREGHLIRFLPTEFE